MEVVINPAGYEETYLEYLNRCFDDWGGTGMYRWCFERSVGGLEADIMVLKKNGVILGGSAVTYRKALIRSVPVDVAIMTGSWTLPESRRKGCFTRIINESLGLAKNKGAAFLLAFVTNRNASLNRLAGEGAALFPTHYLVSGENALPQEAKLEISAVRDVEGAVAEMYRAVEANMNDRPRFMYTLEEWRSQFIDRPEEIELISIGGACLAVIEKKNNFDRVLALTHDAALPFEEVLKALLKRTLNDGRRLFLFTTSTAWKDSAVKLGFDHIPGYLTTLVPDEKMLMSVYGAAAENERALTGGLYDPGSKWYLGNWDLVTGDRM